MSAEATVSAEEPEKKVTRYELKVPGTEY
jgi:hypothetical protein